MNWITPGETDIPVPLPPPASPTMADFMLAYEVRAQVMNAGLNFLSAKPDPQYASPQAYIASLVVEAVNLTQNNFTSKYAPAGWNPVLAGVMAAYKGIEYLKRLPVNAGDPETVSIYDAWIAGTGQLYGGHAPIPPATHPDAGQSAAPPGSIL